MFTTLVGEKYLSGEFISNSQMEEADQFVLTGAGGLDWGHGLCFGPDGNLYVASSLTNAVLRYDGATLDSAGIERRPDIPDPPARTV